MHFLLLPALFLPVVASAADLKTVDCAGLQALYPKLEKTYNRKAPILESGGWGKLRDWTPSDFDYFRTSVLQCREKGFLKKFNPVFLQGDLEKKVEEMRKESLRLKDDAKIKAILAEHRARVNELAKDFTQQNIAELKNIKALLPRITGIDESPLFNEMSKLQARIDGILDRAPKEKARAAPAEPAPGDAPAEEVQKARNADPERYHECETIRMKKEDLVARSVVLEKQLIAEHGVEEMKRLNAQKEEVLQGLDSANLQLRQKGCANLLAK